MIAFLARLLGLCGPSFSVAEFPWARRLLVHSFLPFRHRLLSLVFVLDYSPLALTESFANSIAILRRLIRSDTRTYSIIFLSRSWNSPNFERAHESCYILICPTGILTISYRNSYRHLSGI